MTRAPRGGCNSSEPCREQGLSRAHTRTISAENHTMSGKGAKGLSGKGAKGTLGGIKGGDKKKPISRSARAGAWDAVARKRLLWFVWECQIFERDDLYVRGN